MAKVNFSRRLVALTLLGAVFFTSPKVWAAPKGTNISIDSEKSELFSDDEKKPAKKEQLSLYQIEPAAKDFDENGEDNPRTQFMQF